MAEDLEALRGEIDGLDAQILALLNQRASLSLRVGQLKTSGSIYRPERERQIFERLTALSDGPLPEAHIRAIWREILSSSRALQQPNRVAFLGPEGTHSHAAVTDCFGDLADAVPCRDFREVFSSVSSEACDLGVIPLENSLYGTVGQCFDLFMEHEVFIQSEFIKRIRHCLLSQASSLDAVRRVHSHPQALAQCGHWLHQHLPNAILVPAESTAAAARLCLEHPEDAAIANRKVSELLALPILAHGIEDEADNQTRFVVIGRTPPAVNPGANRSSILFTVPDQPGSLAMVLNLMARAGINLRKLESRPSRLEPWKYAFFADLDLNLMANSAALEVLRAACHSVRLLGCYPAADATVL